MAIHLNSEQNIFLESFFKDGLYVLNKKVDGVLGESSCEIGAALKVIYPIGSFLIGYGVSS